MFNEYPYTDYHELNTDWIIGKIKNVETAETNTKQYAEDADAAKVAAEDARDIAVQAKEDAVVAMDDAVEAKDDAVSFLTDTKDQLDLLQARVDNIIPDGTQTAGNTELLDIRVGYNGVTYGSAGNAVRSCDTILNDMIESLEGIVDARIDSNEIVTDDVTLGKRLADNGSLSTYADGFTTDYMPVIEGVNYYKNSPDNTIYHRICYYDKYYTIIGSASTDNETTAPEGAVYARICGKTTDLATTVFLAVSAKDAILRKKFEDIEQNGTPLNTISASNPSIFKPNTYTANPGITKDDETGDITISKGVSDPTGFFRYEIDRQLIIENIVIAEFDIEITSGTYNVYFFGVTTGGSSYFTVEQNISDSGHYSVSMDLNYEVVYNNLDLNRTIRIGIGNAASPAVSVISNFNVVTQMYKFDTSMPFYSNVNNMYTQIESNSNAIDILNADKYLVAPNGKKYLLSVDNDGDLHTLSVIPNKTLFIGNSLLRGNGAFGMCASSIDNDYYHYVTEAILDADPTATFDKLSGGTFESCTNVPDAQTWMNNTLLSHLGNDIDLVIVQLGDNVNTAEKLNNFETTCSMLIEFIKTNAPNARVAWVGTWYSTAPKQAIIADACSKNQVVFVDISTIRNSSTQSYIGAVIDYGVSASRSYTFDSYVDDTYNDELTITFTVNGTSYTSVVPYASYTVSDSTITITGTYGMIVSSGAASHPGDTGMELIGNLIIDNLGLN